MRLYTVKHLSVGTFFIVRINVLNSKGAIANKYKQIIRYNSKYYYYEMMSSISCKKNE